MATAFTTSGPSKSGKPCERLMALCWRANTFISVKIPVPKPAARSAILKGIWGQESDRGVRRRNLSFDISLFRLRLLPHFLQHHRIFFHNRALAQHAAPTLVVGQGLQQLFVFEISLGKLQMV